MPAPAHAADVPSAAAPSTSSVPAGPVSAPSVSPAAAHGLGAAAYTQGNAVQLGGGAEKHLAHEAAHVVQQRGPSGPSSASAPTVG